MSRLPSLSALRCFEAAARLQHFSHAAKELCLTHGAISRAVRLLEEDLQTPLFERRNRQVFLTPAGLQLYKTVHSSFAQILQTTDALRQQSSQEQRALVLSCEPTLLMRWLIPRWPSFLALCPNPTIHLVAGGGPIELNSGIDLAIRRNDFPIPAHYRSQVLFAEQFGPVCAPEKRASWFQQSAGQWQLHPDAALLHTRTRPQAWSDWLQHTRKQQTSLPKRAEAVDTGANGPPVASPLVFDHFYFSLQAAIAGLGVAIGPWHMVKNDLEQGLLVAPQGFRSDGSEYVLLSRQDAQHPMMSATRQALLDWVQADN